MIEKQIREDALLSRQLQDEERRQILKQNNQVEYDEPPEYQICSYQVKWKVRMSNDKKETTNLLLDQT